MREPDLADFWITPAVNWALANGPWDAVVSSFGPPAAIRVGLALKKRGRCRTWAIDFRDLWTDHHLYGGLIPFTFLERRIERQALALADRLVTVSPQLAKRLSSKCGKPVEVIFNGYDPAGFANVPAERRISQRRPGAARLHRFRVRTRAGREPHLCGRGRGAVGDPGRRVRSGGRVDRGSPKTWPRCSARLPRFRAALGISALAARCERS